jgi:hypothetical protein
MILNVTAVDGWTAVWTRRGTSSTWDGIWTRASGERITTVMEGGIQGNKLDLKRTSSSPPQPLCEYKGTIASDGRSASGTQDCPAPYGSTPWNATIVGGGSVGGGTQGQTNPPPPSPAGGGVNYRVENFVYNAPDLYQNPRNYHDFVVNFANCTIRELNEGSQQGLETIHVSVCRNNTRLTFTASAPGSTAVEYDWVFLNDGKTIAGAYRQGGTFGPSVGGIRP